jgi:Uma2 family endonuclease
MHLSLNDVELPVRLRFERPLTDEELLRFSAENEPWRMEREANGELIVMSPNGGEGGSLEAAVGAMLWTWAREDGRGKVFSSNAGFRLEDGSVRAPDASWVSFGRWNLLTVEQRKKYPPLCPEFVIEVRSETDRLGALEEKMEMWVGNGAEVAWLIDPLRKVVAVYRRGEEREVFEDPTSVQGTGAVRGFELVMGRVWG